MCLDKIDKTVEPCKEGYKMMVKKDGKLYLVMQGNLSKPLRRGRWLSEEDFCNPGSKRIHLVTDDGTMEYPMGFHVCHSKAVALQWQDSKNEIVVEVAVRGPVATGIQMDGQVTVAKQIRILPDKK